ncbi:MULTISPECIES: hypothetical protein [unclassified Arcicella]|uniref:hypothetical protein n=1 Tax=unclassified Arcicella TaxID=2644986 RepID=UPI002858CA38|nr:MULTISPECIES: hypothetical protein [unclassified Arcicella]MDR6564946.1 hypothetical protein [Arcicella sp. BE51]MDR6814736.1 hypothetical protein [Arcicella sp. BE140]MDR6826182.1 hypothetical protein [Arcicella sp. BE139]
MLHPQGNRILFIGASDTGKTYECMQFAKYFRERKKSPKRTIVFDHTKNAVSYPETIQIELKDLDYKLPQRGCFRVKVDLAKNPKDLKVFIDKCSMLTNSCIVLDDTTGLFRRGVPDWVITFLGLRKNNRLEIMFQIHNIKAASPDILENSDIWVIKQTRDSFPIKDTCPDGDIVEMLIRECKKENSENNYQNLWATRIFVGEKNLIYRKDLSKPFLESYQDKINTLIDLD